MRHLDTPLPLPDTEPVLTGSDATLVLGGGCFWCTEAVFLQLEGVHAVEPGYAGGDADSAHYEAVCSGTTGHAEVIRIHFNPGIIAWGELLSVFFSVAHDPTQKNRQGNDMGTQYRSVIFYQTEQERAAATQYIDTLNQGGFFSQPIQTTVEKLDAFYPAEAYHHNFAQRNPQQPYIMFTSAPKVEKVRSAFPDKIKT